MDISALDISTMQAVTGVFISLAIFGLVLWHAARTQARADLIDSSGPQPDLTNRLLARLRVFFAPPKPVEKRIRGNNPGSSIRILAISQDRGCLERLTGLADIYDWDLSSCANCARAAALLETEPVPIVFCDRDILEIPWRDAVDILLRSDRSRCIILCSKRDDDHLWQEATRCGGYDVVRKPIQEEQVVRTVDFAWAFWKTVHPRALPGQHLGT
jgi:hypothetical protein